MINDQNRVYDGWLSLEGGVDAGRAPNMIEGNQCVSAINLTFRGGSATTRPGFRILNEQFFPIVRHPELPFGQRDIHTDAQVWCYNQPFHSSLVDRIGGEYVGDEGVPYTEIHDPPYYLVAPNLTNQNSEYIYRHGKLQCAIRYSPHNGDDCIMAMIGGRLFKIIPGVTQSKVTEVLIEDMPRNMRNMQRLPIAYMVQADKWMIAQDGNGGAIIYDGNKARRSVGQNADVLSTEIPVGTIMAYGMGRLCVVVQDRDVAFGDLYGSHDLPDPADSLILFTERNFLAEGFDAAIPFQQGKATGAIFFPQLDTSTGNGQLMVFSERGASSFFLSLPREQWKTSEFQILALLTTGLRGSRSLAVVNEDLWFRADDGVRSFRQARSEQTGWAHIPLSTNVRQYTDNDAQFLLPYASAIYFDNRILFTTSPMWHQGRPIHWGMVVVDFDVLSSFGTKFNPAWEGQWTMSSFICPTQLLTGTFNGVARAFVFAIDNHNQNQLFELSMDDKDDWNYQPIQWEFESRTLDFMKMTQNPMPFSENELYDGDIWLKEIAE